MAAQCGDDCGDVVFLEEADCGDASCSRLQAGVGVLQCDPSECKDRDFGAAGLAKSFNAGGGDSGGIFFFEHRGKECEIGAVGGGLDCLFGNVTGDRDQRISW